MRRDRLGFTQAELAERVEVSTELISRIERGRCLPSLRTLVALATELKATPDWLLDFSVPYKNRDVDAVVSAVQALPNARRREILRIAEALARYGRDS